MIGFVIDVLKESMEKFVLGAGRDLCLVMANVLNLVPRKPLPITKKSAHNVLLIVEIASVSMKILVLPVLIQLNYLIVELV